MKLLIVTQVIDAEDPVLGFFVRWVEEFSKHTDSVEVICLKKGKYELPENVTVHSLGKEHESNTAPSFARRCVLRTTYTLRFISLAWRLRHSYDTVFVHMNQIYIILGGLFWRMSGKKVSLWYAHGTTSLSLRFSEKIVNHIFTSTKLGFRIKSKKKSIVGQGIDMEQFQQREYKAPLQNTQMCIPLNILTTGRVSETKRIVEMLSALNTLSAKKQSFTFTIAGAPATKEDIKYEKRVKEIIANSSYANNVRFIGAVSHKDIPSILAENNIFLNLSTTGSMDKAVLEALATGMPAVTTNIAFRDLLSPIQGLYIDEATPEKIVNALVLALTADIKPITNIVRERYALPHLIETIYNQMTHEISKQ